MAATTGLTQAFVGAPVNFCSNCYSVDTHHGAELSSNHQRPRSICAAINRSQSGGDVINLPLLFAGYRDDNQSRPTSVAHRQSSIFEIVIHH